MGFFLVNPYKRAHDLALDNGAVASTEAAALSHDPVIIGVPVEVATETTNAILEFSRHVDTDRPTAVPRHRDTLELGDLRVRERNTFENQGLKFTLYKYELIIHICTVEKVRLWYQFNIIIYN